MKRIHLIIMNSRLIHLYKESKVNQMTIQINLKTMMMRKSLI